MMSPFEERQRDLIGARRAAEEANRVKSTFLANMSHEIQMPVNRVMGMATLLLDTDLSSDQQELTETIRGCAGDLPPGYNR